MRIAAETTGCFTVTGTRFAQNFKNLQSVQQQLDSFYKSDGKNNLGNVQAQGATRGFYPAGAETGNKAIFENKESFSFGHDDIPEDFL